MLYIYIYIYRLCTHIYIYIYIFVTVSFHNFKAQNFKLSVSNPKSKYVAYLSVLSQISNCQSLGCKNKHDILKTDRIKCLLHILQYYAQYSNVQDIYTHIYHSTHIYNVNVHIYIYIHTHTYIHTYTLYTIYIYHCYYVCYLCYSVTIYIYIYIYHCCYHCYHLRY